MRKILILFLFAFNVFDVAFSNVIEEVKAFQSNRFDTWQSIYIDTYDSVAITSKEIYVLSKLSIVDGISKITYDSVKIRGRGNGSWTIMPKKSYRIKFPTKVEFLGDEYAKAKNWTLLANCCDKSMIRNALTHELGVFCGMEFNPAAFFVDLYLNGEYQGTYQISDHVDVRKKWVDIEDCTNDGEYESSEAFL